MEWALKNGELEVVMKLIEEDTAVVHKVVKNGRCPLHIAADFGQKEVAEYLLSKGAKINEADVNGITPLLAAIYEGHAETVQLLLKNGADKSVKGPDGLSCVDSAESNDVKQLLQ